jgi:hypothetical protein
LRANFEHNRAFSADARQNQLFAQRKLTMPALGIGGATSVGPIVGEELRHVAPDVRSMQINGTAHCVAEELPEPVTDALLTFSSRAYQATPCGMRVAKRAVELAGGSPCIATYRLCIAMQRPHVSRA